MDNEEKRLREKYFDDDALQNTISLQQFFIQQGRPDLAEPEKKLKGGGLARRRRGIARGCGAIMEGRRKETQYI